LNKKNGKGGKNPDFGTGGKKIPILVQGLRKIPILVQGGGGDTEMSSPSTLFNRIALSFT